MPASRPATRRARGRRASARCRRRRAPLLVDAAPPLVLARARKDAGELALIEAAARLVGVGHAALREAARAGASELDLWGAARGAIEAARAARCTRSST